MITRRAAALLTLPIALSLAACASSATSGSGSQASGAAGSTSAGSSGSSFPSSSAPAPSSSSAATSAQDLARRLQAGVQHIRSAHLTLAVTLGQQSITGSGDETAANGKVRDARVTETIPGGVGTLQIILVGSKAYLKLPAKLNTTGKPYVLVSPTSTNPVVRQLGSSLDSVRSSTSLEGISGFATAAESVKDLGPQSVGGAPATHYSFVVDVAKLPADFPNRSALVASGLTTLPINLWIDAQDRPVRLAEAFTASGQHVTTTVTISRYNAPVSIKAPPASQVSTK